ncbi:MAG: 2-succinyl-5-enolpyruvyl-6-hydroxy-3-cyclohexene-1-carboxylic-acid synthase [Cryobacterium sp.]|nr:2-succinyl-5-enolpyruvyl-6-hydroxy-3-cyclohexene-1-carboxylic-acid synthase [Cryobacterium sp.]MCO5295160.1 2-succinyl-5-enolpyruvyl-6-hydroxy-3-cyclohexene-1-carboxylic-acid synthase [Homoserinimonas sp.]
MSTDSGATEVAFGLLGEFLSHGVRHFVVSPGSRSQALALAAAEFERAGLATLSVRIDERSSGFLALGSAIESGLPAVVITTSGTAVAELMPSVLEAHHSGVPMILLTADRPTELRGIGANQTTDQFGIFGKFVRIARDVSVPAKGGQDAAYLRSLAAEAVGAAVGKSGTPGPIQLNLAFREPLSGPHKAGIPERIAQAGLGNDRVISPERGLRLEVAKLNPEAGTVVIAGHDAGEEAETAARELGAPLFAEVSSGARFGPNLVVAYRDLLHEPELRNGIGRAVVFGHPTLSRVVPELLESEQVEVIIVRGRGAETYNPGRRAERIVDAVEAVGSPGDWAKPWVGSWVIASRKLLETESKLDLSASRTDDSKLVAAYGQTQLGVFREPVTRRMLVESVWQKTWPHDRLVFASSRLIREADSQVPGKKLRVHSNRGLAGIDGNNATALGIAIASQSQVSASSGPNAANGMTRLVTGDLAFLHDSGSLFFPAGETRPRIQIVVGNDEGGSLFDLLEVAGTAQKEAFDRVVYAGHKVKLAELAAANGWDYRLAKTRGELDEALSLTEGQIIIEVPLERD